MRDNYPSDETYKKTIQQLETKNKLLQQNLNLVQEEIKTTNQRRYENEIYSEAPDKSKRLKLGDINSQISELSPS